MAANDFLAGFTNALAGPLSQAILTRSQQQMQAVQNEVRTLEAILQQAQQDGDAQTFQAAIAGLAELRRTGKPGVGLKAIGKIPTMKPPGAQTPTRAGFGGLVQGEGEAGSAPAGMAMGMAGGAPAGAAALPATSVATPEGPAIGGGPPAPPPMRTAADVERMTVPEYARAQGMEIPEAPQRPERPELGFGYQAKEKRYGEDVRIYDSEVDQRAQMLSNFAAAKARHLERLKGQEFQTSERLEKQTFEEKQAATKLAGEKELKGIPQQRVFSPREMAAGRGGDPTARRQAIGALRSELAKIDEDSAQVSGGIRTLDEANRRRQAALDRFKASTGEDPPEKFRDWTPPARLTKGGAGATGAKSEGPPGPPTPLAAPVRSQIDALRSQKKPPQEILQLILSSNLPEEQKAAARLYLKL